MRLGVNPLAHGGRMSPGREAVGLLAAVLALVVLLNTGPGNPPPLPTSDLYTHLSVARHLVQGDGFVTDIAYPLSFAHDFARQLPQPLVHRAPGFALLLTGPVLAARGDPALALRYTGWLQMGLVLLLLWLGMRAYLKRRQLLSLLMWFMLLKTNMLFRLALDWGMVEVACSLVLMVLWLRLRERATDPTPLDGVLAGGLALLRPDLVWVPILWWLWARRTTVIRDRRHHPQVGNPALAGSGPGFFSRRLKLALLTALLVVTPWMVRNTLLTGNPLFSLQAEAELAKDTRTWPGYSVYKQLSPQTPGTILAGDLEPVARKFARGLQFYGRELGAFLHLPQLVGGILVLLWVLLGALTRKWGPPDPGAATGPVAMAVGTLGLLCLQYAPFDHSLRHLLVLLPILAWELAPLFSDNLASRLLEHPGPFKSVLQGFPAIVPPAYLVMAPLALLIMFTDFPILTPTGWPQAVAQAAQAAPQVSARTAAWAAKPEAALFVDWPAVTWYADRPAVWDPGDEAVRRQIRLWLTDDR